VINEEWLRPGHWLCSVFCFVHCFDTKHAEASTQQQEEEEAEEQEQCCSIFIQLPSHLRTSSRELEATTGVGRAQLGRRTFMMTYLR